MAATHNPEWTAYRRAGHTVEETARHFNTDPKTVALATPKGIRGRATKRGKQVRNQNLSREFGLRIRLLRNALGMSQRVLAEQAQIPDATVISRYEDGSRVPNLIDAYNIAQVLGVSLDELCQQTTESEAAK